MQSELPAVDEPFCPPSCIYEMSRNKNFQTLPALNFFALKNLTQLTLKNNLLELTDWWEAARFPLLSTPSDSALKKGSSRFPVLTQGTY